MKYSLDQLTELYFGDCLSILDEIVDESIDLTLTDPPYNISRKNNFNTMGRRGIDFGEWDKGFNQTLWIEKVAPKIKKGGSILIFNAWKNMGDIAKELENNNFIVKDLIRWVKNNPMPRNRDRRYITDFEFCLWAVKKGDKWTFNRQDEKYDRPVLTSSLVSKSERVGHPTQKPVSILEELILRHSNANDIILDPFMGSGSTGVACKNTNRRFIGIELDKDYFEIAKRRIENE